MSLELLAEKVNESRFREMDDQKVADAINALRVTVRRHVPTWLIRREAIEAGYWAKLVDARDSAISSTRALAITVLAWIDDQSGTIQTVDLDRPAVAKMWADLVAANIVTQAQADAISSLANVEMPWTESVGLSEVGIGMIQNVRRN